MTVDWPLLLVLMGHPHSPWTEQRLLLMYKSANDDREVLPASEVLPAAEPLARAA